jgi:hypothetical protein
MGPSTRHVSEAAFQPFIRSRNAEPLEEIAVASTKSAHSSSSSTILPFVVRTITPGRKSRTLCCPTCHSPLNLIQPDEDEPTRLLGLCDSCPKWYFLVELEPEWRKALLVELPDKDELCRSQAEVEIAQGDRGGV